MPPPYANDDVELLGDRFELRHLVGRGGMGDVFQAFDRATGTFVAVKVLVALPAGNALDRFNREIKLLADITDPHIVRYVTHGTTKEGRPYLAMEWLEGQELAEKLVYGRLPIGEAVAVTRRMAQGLAVLHAHRVVHRDVKPSNIFLEGNACEGAKLLDFGVALLADTTYRATQSGVVVGTPGYMAPEQARGELQIDARADIYALGCVLYECLVGEPLYVGKNIIAVLAKILVGETPRVREKRPEVPPELDDLVARMLGRAQIERPADGAALVAELDRIPIAPPEPSDATLTPRDTRAITHTERRLVSVLIVLDVAPDATLPGEDLALGDTTVTAKLDPRVVAAQFGAEVESLADGSLVALVGGKGTATDQAARAARCALELRRHFDASPSTAGRPMALATGFAARDSAFAAQEVIDSAASLLGPTGGVRLDDVTAGLLDHRFAIGGDDAGLVLLGLRMEQTQPRTLLGRPMPFVGRERELQSLLAVVRQCAEDSCARPVLVTAPPGVGKTRLAQETIRAVNAEADVELWFASGDAVSEGAPFFLIAQILRIAAGIVEGEPLAIRQKKLRARVARNVSQRDTDRVTEFLAELIGAPFGEGSSVQLRAARRDPRLMGDQLRTAFDDFVASEARARPLVLVLEDLQWGDLPSVRFVDSVLRNLDELPIAVLAFGRPEVGDLFPGLWRDRNLTEIRLAPLGKRAAESLVRSALGEKASDENVRRILERGSGNAFFLEELIRATAEGNDDFPATVLAMVESRLERLDGEARRVLRAASIFGSTFWERGVAALLGIDTSTGVADWLVELHRRETIDRAPKSTLFGEEEFTFRHALVREAAYATLTQKDCALGHKLAAQWLEAKGGREPGTLAEHYERGGDHPLALRWYLAAAAMAHEGDDFGKAHEHAERAIASGASGVDRGRLRLIQASCSLWASRLDDATRFGREALELLDVASNEHFLAAGVLASIAVRQKQVDLLHYVADDVEAHLGDGPLTDEAVVGSSRVAGSLFHGGVVDRAAALLVRIERQGASAIATEPTAAAWVHYARSMRSTVRWNPEDEFSALERTVEAFDAIGDRRNACLHRINMGSGLQKIGLLELAEEHLRRALAEAEKMGIPALVYAAKHNLAAPIARSGNVDAGIALEREAAEGLRALGEHFIELTARSYLSIMLRIAGRYDEARQELTGVLERFHDMPHARSPVLAALALVEVQSGNAERALPLAREAIDLVNSAGAVLEGESYVRLAYAEALYACGEIAAAKEAIRDARARLLTRAEKLHDPVWRAAFFERVREHVQTLARAQEWLGEPIPGQKNEPTAPTP